MAIEEDVKRRAKERTPPGCLREKDSSSSEQAEERDTAGDVFIWNQLMDHAGKTKKSIVFVTDDQRDGNWWWLVGRTALGPRPELIREMRDQAAVHYHSYTADGFLKYADTHLGVSVGDDIIQEAKDLSATAAPHMSTRHMVMPPRMLESLDVVNRVALDPAFQATMARLGDPAMQKFFLQVQRDSQRLHESGALRQIARVAEQMKSSGILGQADSIRFTLDDYGPSADAMPTSEDDIIDDYSEAAGPDEDETSWQDNTDEDAEADGGAASGKDTDED